jgi:excisionase family DNA binding protein
MDSKTFYSDDASAALTPLSLRPREAAAKLGISVSTLERLTKAGEIPRVKVGNTVLYTVESLERWLKSRETYMGGGAA